MRNRKYLGWGWKYKKIEWPRKHYNIESICTWTDIYIYIHTLSSSFRIVNLKQVHTVWTIIPSKLNTASWRMCFLMLPQAYLEKKIIKKNLLSSWLKYWWYIRNIVNWMKILKTSWSELRNKPENKFFFIMV